VRCCGKVIPTCGLSGGGDDQVTCYMGADVNAGEQADT